MMVTIFGTTSGLVLYHWAAFNYWCLYAYKDMYPGPLSYQIEKYFQREFFLTKLINIHSYFFLPLAVIVEK